MTWHLFDQAMITSTVLDLRQSDSSVMDGRHLYIYGVLT
jgi:hypothetical protein